MVAGCTTEVSHTTGELICMRPKTASYRELLRRQECELKTEEEEESTTATTRAFDVGVKVGAPCDDENPKEGSYRHGRGKRVTRENRQVISLVFLRGELRNTIYSSSSLLYACKQIT